MGVPKLPIRVLMVVAFIVAGAIVGDSGAQGFDGLTHYMCYKVKDGAEFNQTVEIEDQFGKRIIILEKEKFFCVPAVKEPRAVPCEGQVCGEFIPCDTGPPGGDCFCFRRAEGLPPLDGICVDNFSCLDAEPCATDADCPPSKACFVDTCCGGNPGVCGPIECTGESQGPDVRFTAAGD